MVEMVPWDLMDPSFAPIQCFNLLFHSQSPKRSDDHCLHAPVTGSSSLLQQHLSRLGITPTLAVLNDDNNGRV